MTPTPRERSAIADAGGSVEMRQAGIRESGQIGPVLSSLSAADADAVIAALGLVDEECQCGADITHRDEHHRRSVCVRASGHSGAHDDGQGCVWTGGNQ